MKKGADYLLAETWSVLFDFFLAYFFFFFFHVFFTVWVQTMILGTQKIQFTWKIYTKNRCSRALKTFYVILMLIILLTFEYKWLAK